MEQTETTFWVHIESNNALGIIGAISSSSETDEVLNFCNSIPQKVRIGDTLSYRGDMYTVTDILLRIDTSGDNLTQLLTTLKVERID